MAAVKFFLVLSVCGIGTAGGFIFGGISAFKYFTLLVDTTNEFTPSLWDSSSADFQSYQDTMNMYIPMALIASDGFMSANIEIICPINGGSNSRFGVLLTYFSTTSETAASLTSKTLVAVLVDPTIYAATAVDNDITGSLCVYIPTEPRRETTPKVTTTTTMTTTEMTTTPVHTTSSTVARTTTEEAQTTTTAASTTATSTATPLHRQTSSTTNEPTTTTSATTSTTQTSSTTSKPTITDKLPPRTSEAEPSRPAKFTPELTTQASRSFAYHSYVQFTLLVNLNRAYSCDVADTSGDVFLAKKSRLDGNIAALLDALDGWISGGLQLICPLNKGAKSQLVIVAKFERKAWVSISAVESAASVLSLDSRVESIQVAEGDLSHTTCPRYDTRGLDTGAGAGAEGYSTAIKCFACGYPPASATLISMTFLPIVAKFF